MMHIHHQPKRVAVTIDDEGSIRVGTMKYQTGLGQYVVRLDGELSDFAWDSSQVEFIEGGN